MGYFRRGFPNKLGPKTNKFGAKRVELAGRSFASRGEATCFQYLKHLETLGELRDLECQQSVYLTEARIQYIADYKYFDVRENAIIWADYKGFETDVWRIKRKLWMFYGPGLLRVFKGNGTGIRVHEDVRVK